MNYAIVLAAGASTRFTRPKWSEPIDGETLLDRAVRISTDAGLNVVVVSGAYALDTTAEVIHNPNWSHGMATSIVCGIEYVAQTDAEKVVVTTIDQNRVTAEDLLALVDACDPMSAAQYENITGVPACFSRSLFDQLLNLTGDEGARALLRASPDVVPVPMPNAAFDIDTPHDLEKT